MTWREHAAPIIGRVIAEHVGQSEKEIRKAIRDAYPYGQRAMHPYKIWCDEVRKQLRKIRIGKPMPQDPNQPTLF